MSKVVTRPRARLDLADIWEYIAGDNETEADRFLSRIDEMLRLLAGQPLMGRARPELAPELRSFSIGLYIVFYQPLPDGIEVIRVLHGARDIGVTFAAED